MLEFIVFGGYGLLNYIYDGRMKIEMDSVKMYEFISPAMFGFLDAILSYYGILGAHGMLFFITRMITFPFTCLLTKYLTNKTFDAIEIVSMLLIVTSAIIGSYSELKRIRQPDHT